MRYLNPSFAVAVGSKAYRDNFDRIFAKCKACRDSGWCEELIEGADRVCCILCDECDAGEAAHLNARLMRATEP